MGNDKTITCGLVYDEMRDEIARLRAKVEAAEVLVGELQLILENTDCDELDQPKCPYGGADRTCKDVDVFPTSEWCVHCIAGRSLATARAAGFGCGA